MSSVRPVSAASGSRQSRDLDFRRNALHTVSTLTEALQSHTAGANIAKGLFGGCALEAIMTLLFSMVFNKMYGKIAVFSLIGFFVLRLLVLAVMWKCGYSLRGVEDTENHHIMVFVILAFAAGPSAVFLGLSTYGVVKSCWVEEDVKELKAIEFSDIAMKSIANYHEHEIKCYDETTTQPWIALPASASWCIEYLTELFPTIISVGLPLAFAYVITRGFSHHLVERLQCPAAKSIVSRLLTLAVLDFADVSGFAALSWEISAQVYFSHSPAAFRTCLFLLLATYLATWTQIIYLILQGDEIKAPPKGDEIAEKDEVDEEWWCACISVFLIDLPLGLFRVCLWLAKVRVETMYMLKNVVCGLFGVATLMGNEGLKNHIWRCLGYIPVADGVQDEIDEHIGNE